MKHGEMRTIHEEDNLRVVFDVDGTMHICVRGEDGHKAELLLSYPEAECLAHAMGSGHWWFAWQQQQDQAGYD